MKELTREELPDDGTHFVVTFVLGTTEFGGTGTVIDGIVNLVVYIAREPFPMHEEACTNIRYWQFPEGETK